MSYEFRFIVGVLTGATLTAVGLVLWRVSARIRTPMRVTVFGGALAMLVIIAAAIAHLVVPPAERISTKASADTAQATATPAASAGGKAPSMDEAIARLATRLSTGGGSEGDWQLLAQSYDFLGRPDDAQRARQHIANAPAGGAMSIADVTRALSNDTSTR